MGGGGAGRTTYVAILWLNISVVAAYMPVTVDFGTTMFKTIDAAGTENDLNSYHVSQSRHVDFSVSHKYSEPI